MEQNLSKKIEFKDKFLKIFKSNQKKIYFLCTLLLIFIISIGLIKINNEKQNIEISEKYIKAGIYLASNNKEKSKKLYEEVILSKNSFYSLLGLQAILEQNLENDKNKILNYFDIVEKVSISKEEKDLIIFKKALFLIKKKDIENGNNLLKNLIETSSNLKLLAEEVITN